MDPIAAMIRPPSLIDVERELPEDVEPGTVPHALFLDWADKYHDFLNQQYETHHPESDH